MRDFILHTVAFMPSCIPLLFLRCYRAEHHSLYMKFMGNKNVLTAAQCRNAFVHLAYRGLCAAEARINVPHVFKDLGYIDPSKVKLRIPFEFVPPPVPQQPVANGAQPKPKPKAKPVPRQKAAVHHRFCEEVTLCYMWIQRVVTIRACCLKSRCSLDFVHLSATCFLLHFSVAPKSGAWFYLCQFFLNHACVILFFLRDFVWGGV